MKKLFYIYSVLSIWLICACTDQDNIRFDTVLEETTDALYDSVYVDKAEAEVVFTKLSDNFTFENRDLLSRTVISNNIASIVRNERALAYVINLPNEGGFMIISGTKKYGPVLAYSEHGNFHYNDIPETPSDFWLESMLDKLSSQIELPVDSTEQYAVVWKDLLESTKRNGCRQNCRSRYAGDYDMNELQMIMQDSIISWSQHGDYEIINLYEPLTGNESADIQYWKDTEQATYIVYENEWEQLTIGLKRPNGPSKFLQEETINTKWHSSCNSTFKYKIDSLGTYKPYVAAGALAAGQIMNYYRYPEYIDWDAIYTPNYDDYDDNRYISDLLYKICEDTYASYQRTTTMIDPSNLVNALSGYGYDVNISEGLNRGSIPYILYGKIYNRSGSIPSWYEHYITVSGTLSLYFETRIAIYTFTGEKIFNESWHWIEYYSSHLNKIDWHNCDVNNGWYDLNVNMNCTGIAAKSFKILKTINIKRP